MKFLYKTKETQDYTKLGYSFINTYTEMYKYVTGELYRSIYFTHTTDGVESKKYNYRGNAVNAMFSKAKAKAL